MKKILLVALVLSSTSVFAAETLSEITPKEVSFGGKKAKYLFELMANAGFEPHAGDIQANYMGQIICSTPTDDRTGKYITCTISE